MSPAGRLVVLAAPSGAGKTTIAQTLIARRPDVGFSISATTRAPRPGERDGQDYYFLSPAEFERRVRAGDFLEWAEYLGNRYGTLRAEVNRIRRAGRHVLLDIEVQGAAQVRRAYPPPASVSIFVLPPSVDELVRRLTGRGTEAPDVVRQRLARAAQELELVVRQGDTTELFDFPVLNDRLEDAVALVGSIIDGAASVEPAWPVIRGHLQRQLGDLQRLITQREGSA